MILKYIRKLLLLALIIGLFSTNISSQILYGVRIGGGLGSSYYWGSQMDGKISLSTYNRSELNPGYKFQVYKAIDKKNEFGIRYLKTQLWSFKSNNTQAINIDLDEFAFVYQRSLNDNIRISSYPLTFNMLLGLGIIRYSAIAYSITSQQQFVPFSSVGKGNQSLPSNLMISEKQITPAALVGYNIGFRLGSMLTLYFENSFTLSVSNNFAGVLSYKGKLPVNGYTYHAFSVYLNIENTKGKIKCPKF